MSNAERLLRSRFDSSLATAGLAVGDLLVLVGFLAVGELRHGYDPITAPVHVAGTIAPFLVGWMLSSVALGAYTPGAVRRPSQAALRGVATWVPASLIGVALRSTPFFHGEAPLSFVLVVTSIGTLSFAAWRAVAAALLV